MCNNNCTYCFGNYAQNQNEKSNIHIRYLFQLIKLFNVSNLIVTGGEPCLSSYFIPGLKALRKVFPKLYIRVITNGDINLEKLVVGIVKGLLNGITFTDHNKTNREKRLSFIRRFRKLNITNVIIPLQINRLNELEYLLNQYIKAGCSSISLNIIHFPNIFSNNSINKSTQEDLNRLLSINDKTFAILDKRSLYMQLKFRIPKNLKSNPCRSLIDFFYVNSNGIIQACPYNNKPLDFKELRNIKYRNNSIKSRNPFEGFEDIKTDCLIHPGCVCINGPEVVW